MFVDGFDNIIQFYFRQQINLKLKKKVIKKLIIKNIISYRSWAIFLSTESGILELIFFNSDNLGDQIGTFK